MFVCFVTAVDVSSVNMLVETDSRFICSQLPNTIIVLFIIVLYLLYSLSVRYI